MVNLFECSSLCTLHVRHCAPFSGILIIFSLTFVECFGLSVFGANAKFITLVIQLNFPCEIPTNISKAFIFIPLVDRWIPPYHSWYLKWMFSLPVSGLELVSFDWMVHWAQVCTWNVVLLIFTKEPQIYLWL